MYQILLFFLNTVSKTKTVNYKQKNRILKIYFIYDKGKNIVMVFF